MTAPKKIDLTPEELESFLKRVSEHSLQEGDYEIINGMAETIKYLNWAVDEKSVSINRLLKRIFGVKTESSKNLLKKEGESEDNDNDPDDDTGRGDTSDTNNHTSKSSNSECKKAEGHGRNGAGEYNGAKKVSVKCSYNAGDPCPLCPKGKLYEQSTPGVVVRLIGNAPVSGTVYELQKFRCNLCGKVFTADIPKEAGEDKYDPSVGISVGIQKYGYGIPFYRQEGLQHDAGVPLPASTQWELIEKTAGSIYPAYRELNRQGAQGEVMHNDDTEMLVLELEKKIRDKNLKRKGLFTTGIISIRDNIKIALFKTGQKHAGENMAVVLKLRDKNLPPPIQMCDGLSRNITPEFISILCNCLTHGRRGFADLINTFPEECRHVVETFAEIYKHDKSAKEEGMSPSQRLRYHQEKSGPVMVNFKDWLINLTEGKNIEPNSSMGKAISYILKRWEPLTLFLRVENAPLDNNICEQALKRAILHRKNSLFYKTEHGAFVGDVFMSIIHTCRLNKVNSFDYMMSLCKYSSAVFKNPHLWMPWNYKNAVIPA